MLCLLTAASAGERNLSSLGDGTADGYLGSLSSLTVSGAGGAGRGSR